MSASRQVAPPHGPARGAGERTRLQRRRTDQRRHGCDPGRVASCLVKRKDPFVPEAERLRGRAQGTGAGRERGRAHGMGAGRESEGARSRPRRGRTNAPATQAYRPAKAWVRPWKGRLMPGEEERPLCTRSGKTSTHATPTGSRGRAQGTGAGRERGRRRWRDVRSGHFMASKGWADSS